LITEARLQEGLSPLVLVVLFEQAAGDN